jgi:hypothetical protein
VVAAVIRINYLYDNSSDPDTRSVLEDLERERYGRSTVSRLGYVLDAADADDADDDYDAAADAADAAADAAFHHSKIVSEEPDMKQGLKILQIQITTWRAITFVGWLRRIAGDEYHLVDARIITRRSGQPASWNGIAELAENGPGKYTLAAKMKQPEELHRLGNIRRCKPAYEIAWAAHCPKPADWIDE